MRREQDPGPEEVFTQRARTFNSHRIIRRGIATEALRGHHGNKNNGFGIPEPDLCVRNRRRNAGCGTPGPRGVTWPGHGEKRGALGGCFPGKDPCPPCGPSAPSLGPSPHLEPGGSRLPVGPTRWPPRLGPPPSARLPGGSWAGLGQQEGAGMHSVSG